MALSQRAISNLADNLREDFSCFLSTDPVHELALSQVLADAATDFIAREFGDLDEVLAIDLAVELINRIH